MSLVRKKLGNLLTRARLRGKDLADPARANLAALENLSTSRPARDFRYVVLDLETTGLDTTTDKVVAVGAVAVQGGRIVLGDYFHELVNPGRDIPAEAIKVHGITPDAIARARHGAVVIEDFLSFLGPDILVAHYARFDLHFINWVMRERYGLTLQNLVLDTVRMCQTVVLPSDPYGINRERHKCSLESLAGRFGLRLEGRHTALGDAMVTALIFQRMLDRLAQVGGGLLRDLIRVAELN
ncbi:MAG: 3'-5' exonuclease [Deltaproteobacteria bacterium]|nr:3'-5' exonuclease [Deltaproteobacteria bacterium]